MKILLHSEIDSCSDTKDTLSSYHLKTVLFHVLEDVHSDFWMPQNIFYCMRICLTRLLLYLIKGCCPNYFKPKCNLFLKMKILENRKKIEKKLFDILKFDIMDLFFPAFPCSYISKTIYGKCTFSNLNRREKLSMLPELEKILSRKETELARCPNDPLINTLLLAIGTAKGYQTTYMTCIDSIVMIMDLLLAEQDQLKIAFLKHLFLSLIKRIGIIMYDKFILTRLNVYLLSAETAFMLVTHAGVYEGAYLATLWYCHGKYCHCIRLLRFMDLKWERSLDLFEYLKPTCDLMTILSNFEFSTVELYRAHNLFPEDLKDDVQSCASAEFLMQSRSYRLFLEFLCFYEMNKIDINMVVELQQSYVSNHFNLLNNIIKQNSKRLMKIVIKKIKICLKKTIKQFSSVQVVKNFENCIEFLEVELKICSEPRIT